MSAIAILDFNSGSSVKVAVMTDQRVLPNHHAHYPGCSGTKGLIAALSMLGGRDENARRASELCGVGQGDVLVDIGCGPGAGARHAGRLGATVTGVDPERVMLRVARAVTRARTVRYLEGAAENLPVATGSATVVWAIATVHHWRDVDAALAEVRRVLRPDGRFLAIERAREADAQGLASHGWTTEQASTFAEQCIEHGLVGACVERNTTPRSTTLSVFATAD
jgi:ubiquinone/menaquinone biosynthesis C-methylase UbiE